MRIPLSWLRELVDLDPNKDADAVLKDLLQVGFEEEGTISLPANGPIVLGRVVDFADEQHENDRILRWTHIDISRAAPIGILSAASNFAIGDYVLVALPGAILAGNAEVKSRERHGHMSSGVLVTERDLGLSEDGNDAINLGSGPQGVALGQDAMNLLGVDDVAVELNVTPDRGYALSLRGLAREYANSTGASFREPVALSPLKEEDEPGVEVVVDDKAPIRHRLGCVGYVTRIIEGIDSSVPTPFWMRARLILAGIRPERLVIDITNYVMLELGNPLQAYDLESISGSLSIRRARTGEELRIPGGRLLSLFEEDLVVTDNTGPLALAGVTGGARTQVNDDSTRVMIEAATFDSVSVARSARRHKLPTEASRRFERGVDPQIVVTAADRAVDLLVGIAGGTIIANSATFVHEFQPHTASLPYSFVSELTGGSYSRQEVVESLTRVGCSVRENDREEIFVVESPSWRPDLTDKWTLAEEVVRLCGLERIPSQLPTPPPGTGLSKTQSGRRRVANALASSGLVEIQTFPFTSEAANNLHGSANGSPLPAMLVANPIDSTAPYMRRTLVPSLLEAAHRNISRGMSDLFVFEIGNVFSPESGSEYGTSELPPAAERPTPSALNLLETSVPPQPKKVGLLATTSDNRKQGGNETPIALQRILDAIRTVGAASGVKMSLSQTSRVALHPGRAGSILAHGQEVGYFGELHPTVAEDANLMGRVAIAEIDLDYLLTLSGERTLATELSTFPAATQDISLLVPVKTPAESVREAIIQGAGRLLEKIDLIDEYRGLNQPEKKSLTFSLRFRAADHTLTASEATASKMNGFMIAKDRFGAMLRE